MKISQLYTYPVKSLRGCSIASSVVTENGFPYDRSFMLLKVLAASSASDSTPEYENMHVSRFPSMCLFTTAMTLPIPTTPTGTLQITYTNPDDKSTSAIELPLCPDFAHLQKLNVAMHSSKCTGYDMGAEYNDWFSSRFGFQVVFVYRGDALRRVLGNISPNAATRNPVLKQRQEQAQQNTWMGSLANSVGRILGGNGRGLGSDVSEDDYSIYFQDLSPYLVVSQTSVDDVTRRFPDGIEADVTKFRPNVVLEGALESWEEDFWAELSFSSGEIVFDLTSNCARCASLNVDYQTGKPGTGPEGQMLKKLQSDRRVDRAAKYSAIFGRYGFLKPDGAETHVLSVGDQVEVTRRNREHTAFRWPGLMGTSKDDLYPV